jgi:hypothetical protein
MPRKTTEAAATTKTKRSVVRRASTKKTTEAPAVHTWENVAERAYYLSLETDSDPVENWLRAENELAIA